MTAITLATSPLLSAPIFPTLVRLSVPNMLAMVASSLVAIAETVYVGQLGTAALAGLALVFPMVMLMSMLSAGAMGGGVSSAISRALGAREEERASSLALHALLIGTAGGLLSTVLLLAFGEALYDLLGGRGLTLTQALAYSNTVFFGALGIWLTNTLASVVRGGGNMKVPSLTLLMSSVVQVVLGGCLGLGLGPFPKLGMAGIALGQVIAVFGSALLLLWYLMRGRSRVRLSFRAQKLQWDMFRDILKVGGVACLSPLQTILTALILTRLVAQFGTEALAGYGIGSRLEFLLIPIAFGVGVACVPMVGMAVGAGQIARARNVAWIGGLLAAGLVGVAGVIVALFPDLWARSFSSDPAVLAFARSYFQWVGPAYPFFGLGLCLYFASQGSGKIIWPVLAGTLRLLVVLTGAWWLSKSPGEAWQMFALIALALVVYGAGTAASIYFVSWQPKRIPETRA
jgi:putative MATE family efflux protein